MLKYDIQIQNYAAVLGRLNAAEEAVNRETLRAMHEAVLDVEGEVIVRTPVDGGRLRNSITTDVRGEGLAAVGIVAVANVPYAPFVEEGTGVYAGRQPWTVRPKPGRRGANNRPAALRIPLPGGGVIFRRKATIRGMKGRFMFREGRAAAAPQVQARFRAAVARITRG